MPDKPNIILIFPDQHRGDVMGCAGNPAAQTPNLDRLANQGVSINTFFAPQILAWIFIGYIAGSIAKGVKRGLMAGLITLVIVLLIWILFAVIAGEDLMAMFAGAQLNTTLGGILTGVLGAVLGGLAGGAASGPYEEFY